MNPIEEIMKNNKAIADSIIKQGQINKQVSELIDERNKYKELIMTFKSMFEHSGNDLYLEMISKVLTN